MSRMRTIDKQFTPKASLWQRLWRDGRLLWRMARMLSVYIFVGGRIRRAYHDKAAHGEIYWLDQ